MSKSPPSDPMRTMRAEGRLLDAALPLKVHVRDAGGMVSEVSLEPNQKVVVGKDAACDIVLADRMASRKHVELLRTSEGILVRDLGSSNGTFLLDQRIKEIVASPGTTIVVGRTQITIDLDQEYVTAAPPYDGDSYEGLVGESAPMRRLYGILQRLERTRLPVLVEGESGVGKELVARAIHARSPQKAAFVAVNCGAFERSLAQSELFGHRRGAFTGATDHRDGAFVVANGGTLFLDEVGELPLDVQPMLLRVLETAEVRPVGADRAQKVDVRVVTATNRDLEEEVRAKRFREDLFYRLAVVRVTVPPLRARLGDVSILVRRFAAELGADVPDDVVRALASRRWSGNVRELRNAVQSYTALGVLPDPVRLGRDDLDTALRELAEREAPYAELKDELVDRFTRSYLTVLLARCGGNRTEAAKRAGIDRSYINRLLAKHRAD